MHLCMHLHLRACTCARSCMLVCQHCHSCPLAPCPLQDAMRRPDAPAVAVPQESPWQLTAASPGQVGAQCRPMRAGCSCPSCWPFPAVMCDAAPCCLLWGCSTVSIRHSCSGWFRLVFMVGAWAHGPQVLTLSTGSWAGVTASRVRVPLLSADCRRGGIGGCQRGGSGGAQRFPR
jgi:hypothetical protein